MWYILKQLSWVVSTLAQSSSRGRLALLCLPSKPFQLFHRGVSRISVCFGSSAIKGLTKPACQARGGAWCELSELKGVQVQP